MTKAIVLYMPVIHQGYVSLIERHQPVDVILLSAQNLKSIDQVIADQFSRDIRTIPTHEVAAYLHCKFPALNIREFEEVENLTRFNVLVMPDEDISRILAAKVSSSTSVVFDNAFLRWDWRNTNTPKEVVADYKISTSDLDKELMGIAQNEAQKSSDFWRQVGALIPLKEGFLVAYNEHLPTSMEPYETGDMRLIMKPGEKPEICGAIHAEKALFAKALRKGIALYGEDMYVTTFPCLPCAQMISRVGIKRLFFKEGYSNQNAVELLRAAKVEIIQVK